MAIDVDVDMAIDVDIGVDIDVVIGVVIDVDIGVVIGVDISIDIRIDVDMNIDIDIGHETAKIAQWLVNDLSMTGEAGCERPINDVNILPARHRPYICGASSKCLTF